MYSFIVLGEIPGTNITISFTMWLLLCVGAALTIAYVRVHRNRTPELRMQPTIGVE